MSVETVKSITAPPEFIEAEAKLFLDDLRKGIGAFKGADLSKTEWWLMGDINKALKEKFLCSAQFAQDIEAIVKDDNLGYIDAIVHYCEQNAIDVESVPKLISKPLKEKLKWEATELNYLKRTSRAKLPL